MSAFPKNPKCNCVPPFPPPESRVTGRNQYGTQTFLAKILFSFFRSEQSARFRSNQAVIPKLLFRRNVCNQMQIEGTVLPSHTMRVLCGHVVKQASAADSANMRNVKPKLPLTVSAFRTKYGRMVG
jgi:hypothetical protein